MHLRAPYRLFPDEYPSLPRLVQLVLCDDEWARVDAYRVSYTPQAIVAVIWLTPGHPYPLESPVHLKMAHEHVYGIRLDEREAEARIRQKTAIQQRLRSFPPRYVYGLESSVYPPNNV